MTTTVETIITNVTVYTDRARVTRSGKVSVEAGRHRLEIPKLPLTLSPESVRVSGQGTARARLGSVDLRHAFYTQTPSTAAAELERRIEELGDQESTLSDEVSVLETSLNFLNGLAEQGENYSRGLAYGKFSVNESANLLEFIAERTAFTQERLRAIAIEKRDLERQKTKLEQELGQIRNARPRERYTAAIDIEALTAGDLEIELVYIVSKAAWTPLYDLRLSESSAEQEPSVEISYLAQVTQRSGEDWSNVQLTLSTARPALSATLPELDPWYVQVYQPLPPPMPAAAPRAKRSMKKQGGMLRTAMADFAGAEPEAEPEPVQMEVVQAKISQEGGAVTFNVPQPADVPSDGSPHKSAIATISLRPELDYLTAPKLVEAAYRRATISNDSEFILLPGSASIFYGNEFIGATKLKHVAPNESFKIFLGVDDRIKVERKLISRQVDKRLLGDKRRLRYAYQIKIKNLRDQVARIIIQDQLPVSGHESVKIQKGEIQPPPDKQTDLGILEWDQSLEAGQELELTFEFSVEHPRDLTITGLPTIH